MVVHGESEEKIHEKLWEAVRAGLVYRAGGVYTFVHDRVQESAYTLIPPEQRASEHLRIGRLLVLNTPPEAIPEHVFEIVTQFNRAAPLVSSREEREQVAELNLIAGRRAKASTAYASALRYLAAGSSLLSASAWEGRYALAFALELQRAECESLVGDVVARPLSHRRSARRWRRFDAVSRLLAEGGAMDSQRLWRP